MQTKSSIDPSKIEPNIQKNSDVSWTITLEEDPDTGDLVMPLPDDLMEAQGWAVGDTLVWDFDNNTQTATLTKKKP